MIHIAFPEIGWFRPPNGKWANKNEQKTSLPFISCRAVHLRNPQISSSAYRRELIFMLICTETAQKYSSRLNRVPVQKEPHHNVILAICSLVEAMCPTEVTKKAFLNINFTVLKSQFSGLKFQVSVFSPKYNVTCPSSVIFLISG